jgi:hypothetical protein
MATTAGVKERRNMNGMNINQVSWRLAYEFKNYMRGTIGTKRSYILRKVLSSSGF